MKKAVMYGAGNIGRGFIGKVFSESGYEVCFIDVDEKIVSEINRKKEYPVKIVTSCGNCERIVKNVRAVNGLDTDKVIQEIATADIMATAVGVNVLPKIVKPICAGLEKRFDKNRKSLNIIICENLIDADQHLRKWILDEMGEEYKELLDQKLGLVEASIGRMVPVMTDDRREGNILKVWVEPYEELPVDGAAFVGEIPELNGLIPYSPFGYYIKRKLFIHNMGHVICAYMGWQKRYDYIYECVADERIQTLARNAMRESAKALHREYDISLAELNEHIDDLLNRFANNALGDTVARVARDPLRKLSYNDRLVGAALYCAEQEVEPVNILKGIVAGLRYDNTQDESAVVLQALIDDNGIKAAVKRFCGSEKSSKLNNAIVEQYQKG